MARAGLSTELVVTEAEALADEVGLGALTLAALAERLGVRVPSLYKHVPGLDGLHRLIEVRAKHELGDVLGRAAVGVAGPDAVAALAGAYRDWAQRHPGRYQAILAAPRTDAAVEASGRALAVVEAALSGYRLAGDAAIDAVRMVRAALHGFIALEAAGGFGLPRDVDRSFQRMVAGLIRALESWQAPPVH